MNLSEAPQPSTTGREELAPGTPAQQSPPVVSQVATPNGKPLFVFPDPRTRMPPGSVAHMMVQTPQTGRPPPPPEGYARPHSSRDDGRMRFTPAFHGPQVLILAAKSLIWVEIKVFVGNVVRKIHDWF